ncbi:hypothetical protein NQD34_000028 [Periophthalmus magnuspinnatus]|nr:hypothetical protein NQD34_000028 [Periophthalmus magnuspinnatus]
MEQVKLEEEHRGGAEEQEEQEEHREEPEEPEEPELCMKPEPREFFFKMVTVKTEDDEDKSSVLHQRPTEKNREETNREECGADQRPYSCSDQRPYSCSDSEEQREETEEQMVDWPLHWDHTSTRGERSRTSLWERKGIGSAAPGVGRSLCVFPSYRDTC